MNNPVYKMSLMEYKSLSDKELSTLPNIGDATPSHSNYYGIAVREAIYQGKDVPIENVKRMAYDHRQIINHEAEYGGIHCDVLNTTVQSISNTSAFEFHREHAGLTPELRKKVDIGEIEFYEGLAGIGNVTAVEWLNNKLSLDKLTLA